MSDFFTRLYCREYGGISIAEKQHISPLRNLHPAPAHRSPSK